MSRRPFVSRLSLESLEARETPAAVGAVDPSFDANGVLSTNFGGTDMAAAVAIQPDGKIVVAGTGTANIDFAVARYNPDGSLDTSFGGGDGKFTYTFGLADRATGLAIQPDGNIVVVGYTDILGTNDFAAIRVLGDGSGLDPAFGGGGKVVVPFDNGGAKDDRATGVALQADGKIVIVGSVEQAADFEFGVVRLNTNGSLDMGFNWDGKRTVSFDLGGANEDKATGVAIQPDGMIVVAGYAQTGAATFDFAVTRLDPTTSLQDTAFDTDGLQTVSFSTDDRATAVAIDASNRIVLVGNTSAGVDFAVARFNPDGMLDATFGTGGKVTPTLGGNDVANAVALQKDGKIVIAGRSDSNSATDNFAAVRLNPDGTFDPSFDANGIQGVGLGGDDTATGVAIDANGRIVLAGSTTDNDNFALARLVGGVEEGRNLVVGGGLNGAALVHAVLPDGTYSPAPTATVLAFPGFGGNVRTATADVNGDGVQDTLVATGPGTARFAVVSGTDNTTLLVNPTDPFGDANFAGGLFIAAGDFDGDGRAEIVLSPDQGGGPRVTMFSLLPGGLTPRANFLGIDDANFRGGARVAVGDITGDGVPDLGVSAGFLGGPRVALFDGKTAFGVPARVVNDFFGFPGADVQTLRNGAFLSLGDVDGDGRADLVLGGGPGGAPRVFILGGALLAAGDVAGAQAAPIANYFVANNTTDSGGVRVSTKDADGDQKADVAVGSGDNVASRVRVYFGDTFAGGGEPAGFQDLDPYAAVLANGVFVG